MPTILRTSLDGLFDDAGLFPPAQRPMAEAMLAHADARSGAHARFVGPFLCPAGRLDELAACAAGGVPLPERLSVVLYPGDEHLRRSLARPGVVQVEAQLGTRLPEDVLHLRQYFEIPPAGDVRLHVLKVSDRRRSERTRGGDDHMLADRPGVKVRCGGPTPDTVPSVERLAAVVHQCAAESVVLKATAGLHRAFRHRDEATGTWQHGFVNLLAAATAAIDGHGPEQLAELLAATEEDGDAVLASVDRRARELLAAIGTCNLDEPIGELEGLGLSR